MSLLTGMVYGYTTGIVAGIKEPAVNFMFNTQTIVAVDEHYQNNWTCNATSVTIDASAMSAYYGLFTADILLGNLIGAYLGPWTSEKYGRRKATILNGSICIVSSLLMFIMNDFSIQVLLRVIQGISIGYCATVGPSYVSEVSPPSKRGQLGTLFQLFICGFMAVGMLSNVLFNPLNIIKCLPTLRWKLQLAMAAIPGIFMLLYALCWMPESPVWLEKQSKTVYNQYSSLLDNDHSSTGILGSIDENNSFVGSNPPKNGHGGESREEGGWSLMCSRRGFKWLIIVVTLPMAQQLTGINAIMFYGPNIISNMGFENSLVVTFLVVGVWNLLSVFVSFALVDRVGRRVLMLSSLLLMGIATVVMGILFHSGINTVSKAVPLSMIMLFILAFESGPGPLFFVILNEVFPKTIRSEAISLANMLQSGMNIALSLCFPILIVALGDKGKQKNGTGTTFFILGGFVVLSMISVWAYVPESAGTINTDINVASSRTIKKQAPNSLMNERLEFQGKKQLVNGIIDTPAGVHWTPTLAH
jgi:SP family arabinose:H+ symporter-like MFS transporter